MIERKHTWNLLAHETGWMNSVSMLSSAQHAALDSHTRNIQAMTFVCPFDVSLDYTCSVVINLLHRLIRHIDEWDIVEVPLMVVQSREIRFMIQDIGGTEMSIGKRIRSWVCRKYGKEK
jgi:hypothetical protein